MKQSFMSFAKKFQTKAVELQLRTIAVLASEAGDITEYLGPIFAGVLVLVLVFSAVKGSLPSILSNFFAKMEEQLNSLWSQTGAGS